jgi:hypothetical protein
MAEASPPHEAREARAVGIAGTASYLPDGSAN